MISFSKRFLGSHLLYEKHNKNNKDDYGKIKIDPASAEQSDKTEILMLYSPNGKNWFYEFYKKANKNNK